MIPGFMAGPRRDIGLTTSRHANELHDSLQVIATRLESIDTQQGNLDTCNKHMHKDLEDLLLGLRSGH